MSKVKICGLRLLEDVAAVNRALPDFAGFVFAESRRRVDMETAAGLKQGLDARIRTVGVFVNQEVDFITVLYRKGIINLIQLHGDEDSEYIRRLKKDCDCPVIKVVSVGKVLQPLPLGADYALFDAASQQRGGSGTRFDWSILQGYGGPPYFLAGGLTPENVREAVRLLAPFCVDVSSGVETDGVKDTKKINEFVRLVRGIR
jgi:phosphoribosylanthranilate isomerase